MSMWGVGRREGRKRRGEGRAEERLREMDAWPEDVVSCSITVRFTLLRQGLLIEPETLFFKSKRSAKHQL